MTTKLERPLRREIEIDGEPWVVTLEPALLKLTRKGHRKGVELAWDGLISGDAALAAALNASVRGRRLLPLERRSTPKPVRRKRRARR
jgi:hypothetical protein